ncbi:uncharacterized protein [Gossypium hirsutum]|uniref:Uncharacterized protein n=1 Tax=Gossypium hirsutum TaxID=3635 RepID=A0A1U8HMW9_GOSHI|nr:uncharacterized protein LOC107887657 [Gossypium hirsutum]
MEMVKKEIAKLLDADIIYPISDSRWVSLVQVMPKKTGVTVKKNAEGFFQIPVAPEDQEKTTFTSSFGTFVYRRIPFGLRFYRYFVKHFSKVAEPRCELLQKDKKIEFGPKCKKAFDTLKQNFQECENLVAGHLSRLKIPEDDTPIKDEFPDESLFSIEAYYPWYADKVNLLTTGSLPTELARSVKDKLRREARYYIWDYPYL